MTFDAQAALEDLIVHIVRTDRTPAYGYDAPEDNFGRICMGTWNTPREAAIWVWTRDLKLPESDLIDRCKEGAE